MAAFHTQRVQIGSARGYQMGFAQLAPWFQPTVRPADRMFMHRRLQGERPHMPLRHEVALCE